MKLDIQLFAFDGEGKSQRKSYIVGVNVGTHASPEWEIIGKDNEEINRALNNDVEAVKNVLGETEVEVTLGNQVTTVDPFKQRRESKFSQKLYEIYKYDKELSDVEFEFIEINQEDKIGTETVTFGAFTQVGAVDMKSYGGPAKYLTTPFDINWKGSKTHGTFDPTAKTFTQLSV